MTELLSREEFRTALDGVSRLSSNIAAKNGQINELLGNLRGVSEVLDARDQDIVGLMRDSDVLFRALVKRRTAVHQRLGAETGEGSETLDRHHAGRMPPRMADDGRGDRVLGARLQRRRVLPRRRRDHVLPPLLHRRHQSSVNSSGDR